MKNVIIMLICCALFLGGCVPNQAGGATLSVPGENDGSLFSVPKRLTLKSVDEITAYANGAYTNDGYVAHEDFITLEQIENLGSFKGGTSSFSTDMRDDGIAYAYTRLVDARGFAFEIAISHGTGVERLISENYATKLSVPFGTKSMAQIEVDGIGHVRSSGFYYRYINGKLNGIITSIDGVVLYIKPETEFYEYPQDGERTFLSLVLSTSFWDQVAAMQMLRRCFPKTWVHYAVYCGIALVAVAVALGVFFVIRARRAKKKAISCTGDEQIL